MSVQKEKRMKKLRKKRIWPSVCLFLICVLTFSVFIGLFLQFFMAYIVNGKLESAYNGTAGASKMIEQTYNESGSWDNIFTKSKIAKEIVGNETNICVVDKNNKIVTKQGNKVPQFDKHAIWDDNEEFKIYFDKASDLSMIDLDDGEMNIPLDRVAKDTLYSKKRVEESEISTWSKGKVADVSYWMEIPIGNTGCRLLMNHMLSIERNDVKNIMIMGGAALALMTIPMLLILINMISSIVNQKRMAKLLYMDPITGGDNWICFSEHAVRVLSRRKNVNKRYWLLSMRMNKYQSFCTCYGSKAGEDLLEQMNVCIKTLMHKKEFLSRYAKADFVLLLDSQEKEQLEARTRNILEKLQQLRPKQRLSFHVGVFEIVPENLIEGKRKRKRTNVDVDNMYMNASTARVTITGNDGNEIAFFNEEMLEQQLWERHVEDCMEEAMRNKEFKVYLQPKYSPTDEKLGGAEALVRWINEADGFIPPNRFIPIFEENGFVLQLDDYMMLSDTLLSASATN